MNLGRLRHRCRQGALDQIERRVCAIAQENEARLQARVHLKVTHGAKLVQVPEGEKVGLDSIA